MERVSVVALLICGLTFATLNAAMADPQGSYHKYNGVTYYVTQILPGSREIALNMPRSKYESLSQSQRAALKSMLVKNYVNATHWHGQVILNLGDENGNDLDFLEVDNP
jgi:hypothetical protein